MQIGFDAKRIFFNRSGLGVYSRSTVDILAKYAPDNRYVLFSPKHGNTAGYVAPDGVETLYPTGILSGLPSYWRSCAMSKDIRRSGVEIYHGLSHELPLDISKAGIRSVITMHDLIFIRYPELYKPLDRKIYSHKYLRSCQDASHIIAISRQTKSDLMDLWDIDDAKITVVYQGCNPLFAEIQGEDKKTEVQNRYSLPSDYILSVGTIERRKNLMLTVKAMAEYNIDVQLVACGRHTPYADEIMSYAVSKGIQNRIHFRHDVSFADLPAIYQMAGAFVYTSFYEGFGIPILEALNSRVPVITTEGGVFVETGGDAVMYVNPRSEEQMADLLRQVLSDTGLRKTMTEKGLLHARNFTEPKIAENLISVYSALQR